MPSTGPPGGSGSGRRLRSAWMPHRFAFLECRELIPFAHRGGNEHHPENTLEAFQHAIDLGFEHLETDVHASADGELYAFHDAHLGRVAGVEANIGDLTSDQLDTLRFDGYRLPRLAEILASWPSAYINIDPKSDAAVEPLLSALRRSDAVGRVCIGSFSDRRIEWCRRELGPALCTSMGPVETLRLWLRSRGTPTGRFRAACVQVPIQQQVSRRTRVTFGSGGFVDAAHDAGVDVHFWTINDESTMHRLIDLGADGIMTDRPDRLRSVLVERGRWERNDEPGPD